MCLWLVHTCVIWSLCMVLVKRCCAETCHFQLHSHIWWFDVSFSCCVLISVWGVFPCVLLLLRGLILQIGLMLSIGLRYSISGCLNWLPTGVAYSCHFIFLCSRLCICVSLCLELYAQTLAAPYSCHALVSFRDYLRIGYFCEAHFPPLHSEEVSPVVLVCGVALLAESNSKWYRLRVSVLFCGFSIL